MPQKKLFKNGYSGGRGGTEFIDDDKGENAIPLSSKVSEVNICDGWYIDSIQIVHFDFDNDRPAPLIKHGGTGGNTHPPYELGANEHITGISGKFGQYVNSLIIHTTTYYEVHEDRSPTTRESPRFGGGSGDAEFNYEAPKGWAIVGLYGRAGTGEDAYIDAIGVVLRELDLSNFKIE